MKTECTEGVKNVQNVPDYENALCGQSVPNMLELSKM